MDATIVILDGDGIGPEVTAEARKILAVVADRFGHSFEFDHQIIGGGAIDKLAPAYLIKRWKPRPPLTPCCWGRSAGRNGTVLTCQIGPSAAFWRCARAWTSSPNLRPVKLQPQLISASTIKEETLQGVDLLVVRELTGGIYFGQRKEADDDFEAYDTMVYTRPEIDRVVRLAADSAMERKRRIASVDKANVLASSRLWRKVATEALSDYPDLEVEHILVDAMAMHLIRRPADFDVIVAGNLFGDVLTDEASMLAGSMGMLPSASLGDVNNRHNLPLGLYEPIHGSAPDIAGQGIANPLAAILSCAMLLRHSLGLEEEAAAVEAAVDAVLTLGVRTPDIAQPGTEAAGTEVLGDLVAQEVQDS